jgi:hypothetical protein
VQLDNVLGLRFNVWTSIVLFVGAAVWFYLSARSHPGREDSVYRDGSGPGDGAEPGDSADATDAAAAEGDDDRNESAEADAEPDESNEEAPAGRKASTDD